MSTGTLAPVPWLTFVDADGKPYAGAKLFTYTAGTDTKQTTYSDVELATPNTNPIVLDTAGRCVVYLDPKYSYKFVLAPSTDTDPPAAPIKTQDDISNAANATVNVDVQGVVSNAMVAAGDVVVLCGPKLGSAGTWQGATDSTAYTQDMYGIALGSGDIGETIWIRILGKVTNQAGKLVAGTTYYLSNTVGALTATPAAGLARAIGVADGTSSLIMPAIQMPRTATATFGKSSGQGNAAGGADTELTGFAFTIGANTVNAAGEGFVLEGKFELANNANAKVVKMKVGGGNLMTVFSNSSAVAGHIVVFRLEFRRRTSATGSLTGLWAFGAASGAAPTFSVLDTTLGAVDWTTAQAVKVYASANGASDIVLAEMWCRPVWGGTGALV